MKTINLTKGYVALVDDDDFDYLNQFNWSAHIVSKKYIYAERYYKQKAIFMHSEIMATPLNMVIDHIDHNTLNNQKKNLRVCTISENFLNRRPSSKTGFKGVYVCNGRILAQARINKKTKHLGYFDTVEDAALAVNEVIRSYNSIYHNLNIIP